ncbi:YcfL family protein [Campylobacter lari]|uniref:YcfL family protein n=1 Tax=Campylobacter lari TaxID=201 RepID=UPI002149EB03|nr:YcfL family protein [Campylobacter lari]MCR2082903.1 YcfL family protein [Campylobacter lari subsp. concheus]MCR2084250.1 YcfL family protein [Campylobacter lari subsp. concheus]
MKKIIFLLLLNCMFLVSQDTFDANFEHTNVKSVKERINNAGLLEVQIIFYSSVDKKLSYKIEWFDKDGFVIKNTIDKNYKNIRLLAKQEYIIQNIASNKQAKKYKIYIK